MNKFIIGLFNQFNYKVVSEADGISFIKHNNYADFWIIKNALDAFKLEEQETIADKAKTTFDQHKEVAKNTSLLVLLEVNQISEDIIDTIIEIENDPFYFKKYVLAYTKRSKKTIETLRPENFSSSLMRPEEFKALKDEADNSGPYHLLYSIAHKLPFIMTDVKMQEATLLSNQYTPSEELQDAFKWMQSIDLDAEDLEKEVMSKFERLMSTDNGTI